MAWHMATSSPQVPLGLIQLQPLNRVQVLQQRSSMSRTVNEYFVTSPDGVNILYAKDVSWWVGPNREFSLDIFDSQNQEVIRLRRPSRFVTSLRMDVAVCGQPVSIVRQELTFFKKVLSINDVFDRPVLRVKGPAMISDNTIFNILSPTKVVVGTISKHWRGVMNEMFSSSDSYQVQFPADLDVRYKAVLVGTCIFIDFLYTKN